MNVERSRVTHGPKPGQADKIIPAKKPNEFSIKYFRKIKAERRNIQINTHLN